ncbi:unnamed protein product [Caenorhabditis bovis]|uniref:G-protein coupled receptors family 1 profile domain-containing protein n=1 Tax=Caenorhabditis bovis TaxID=2654633 RepID=A0A8S1EPB7_9PELO|nr:unnamed protein product [Caenorhabditis bovis]
MDIAGNKNTATYVSAMSEKVNELCANSTDNCYCLAQMCPIVYNHSVWLKEKCYMEKCFISKRALDDVMLYRVTALYAFIFLVGVFGNVTTCLVMKRHPLMKTHASMYLFNLAVSDLVTLTVGLPFEVMMNWNQYPWPFPDCICNLKALIAETTSSVSMLTILVFAVERYVAICHPLYLMKVQPFKRNIRSIIWFTWIFSIFCAMPFAIHHRTDFMIKSWPYTNNNEPVLSSKLCMVAVMFDRSLEPTFKKLFHFSAIAFFVIPLLAILILYARIACQVSKSSRIQMQRESDGREELQMRINAILCSIVLSFFICYLPFQMQRLLFFYVDNEWILLINQYIYFISGFLFYLATIVNPILYNLVSSRFRKASKDILLALIFHKSIDYQRTVSKYSM